MSQPVFPSHRAVYRSLFMLLPLVTLGGASSPGPAADPGKAPPATVDLGPSFEAFDLSPRAQGERPTCSAFVVAQALEFTVARKMGRGRRLSVEYLNWASNDATGEARDGGNFLDLWKGFQEHGICTEASMPYLERFRREQVPGEAARSSAKETLALDLRLHWIKEWDPRRGLTDRQLRRVRETLAAGWPVCAGLLWPKEQVWEKSTLRMCPRDAVRDGHSVLLVGYRDDREQPGGGVFLIRNSSGKLREGLLTYEYVKAYTNDAAWIDFKGAEASEPPASGEVSVISDHSDTESATPDFKFEKVPPPVHGDAATEATFRIVDGRRDPNSGDVRVLNDSRVPRGEDQPSANFFFRYGTEGGRLLVDLGKPVEIREVNTYSWHPDSRGPQVYQMYASTGSGEEFRQEPEGDVDPTTCGWKLIAKVDTREKGGGQHAVSITAGEGNFGAFRYLLFAMQRTEARDPFGNTFYSEIDVLDARGSGVVPIASVQPARKVVEVTDGTYRISMDVTETPDLAEWVREELSPVVKEWYPKIVALLPSEGYSAPRRVRIFFSDTMRGVAATGGTRIRCAAGWYRRNLEGEALGSVVHELVHVVQQYGRAGRRGGSTTRPPGWLVEGIADYIRWFLYEPETRGAEISRRSLGRAQYNRSYRVSANFIDWVTRTHDKDIVLKLNAAAREGRYKEELWKEYTGRTVEELGKEWKAQLEKKLGAGASAQQTTYRIGNSLTWDSQPGAIEKLAAQRGWKHREGYHINCGKSLQRIWENPEEVCVKPVAEYGTFRKALTEKQWSAVALQPYPAKGESTLATDAARILDFISLTRENEANAETVFYIYAGWPAQSLGPLKDVWGKEVTDDDSTPTILAEDYFGHLLRRVRGATDAEVRVIPVGHVLAALDGRIQAGGVPGFTSITQLYRDNVHLTGDVGRYVAGITTLAALFGRKPTETERPDGTYGKADAISPALYRTIHDTVWEVLTSRKELTGVGPASASAGESSPFRFEAVSDASLGLWEGDLPVFVYNHGMMKREGVPEHFYRSGYIHPLYGLEGEVLTDDFPKDHFHHRGLFWGWPHVIVDGKEYQSWVPPTVLIRLEKWKKREAAGDRATLALENGWYTAEGRIVAEDLKITVHRATETSRAIDLDFTWTACDKPVTLRGAEEKSYGGLTLRFAPRESPLITVPSGRTKEDLTVARLPWADYTGAFEGASGRSGAAIFVSRDHPDYPPEWLTRHYGCLCVGWPGVEPTTLEPGKPVRCRYRVWVHRGEPRVDDLAAACEAYTK